jgi:hypothetical protein
LITGADFNLKNFPKNLLLFLSVIPFGFGLFYPQPFGAVPMFVFAYILLMMHCATINRNEMKK